MQNSLNNSSKTTETHSDSVPTQSLSQEQGPSMQTQLTDKDRTPKNYQDSLSECHIGVMKCALFEAKTKDAMQKKRKRADDEVGSIDGGASTTQGAGGHGVAQTTIPEPSYQPEQYKKMTYNDISKRLFESQKIQKVLMLHISTLNSQQKYIFDEINRRKQQTQTTQIQITSHDQHTYIRNQILMDKAREIGTNHFNQLKKLQNETKTPRTYKAMMTATPANQAHILSQRLIQTPMLSPSSINSHTTSQRLIPPHTPAQPLFPPQTPAQPLFPPHTPAQPLFQAPMLDPSSINSHTPAQPLLQALMLDPSSINSHTPAQPLIPPHTPAQPLLQALMLDPSSINSHTPAQPLIPPQTPVLTLKDYQAALNKNTNDIISWALHEANIREEMQSKTRGDSDSASSKDIRVSITQGAGGSDVAQLTTLKRPDQLKMIQGKTDEELDKKLKENQTCQTVLISYISKFQIAQEDLSREIHRRIEQSPALKQLIQSENANSSSDFANESEVISSSQQNVAIAMSTNESQSTSAERPSQGVNVSTLISNKSSIKLTDTGASSSPPDRTGSSSEGR